MAVAEAFLRLRSDEFDETPAVGARAVMVRRYLEDRLAALPPAGAGYHHGLLGILDDLTGRGHANPEQALAAAMRVPEETLQAALQVARQRLGTERY